MENKPANPFFPLWAHRLVVVNQAVGFTLLMVKKVDASDISEHHNGFLLGKDVVETKLIPYLTDEEREKASLLTFNDKKNSDGEGSSSCDRRTYDGLNVSVYVEGGWRIELLLTHYDRSGCTVLKGNELELLRGLGNLKEGDTIAIWMFRPRDDSNNKNKLCFCFVKIFFSLFGTDINAR